MTVVVVRNNIMAADRIQLVNDQTGTINKLYTIDAGVLRPVRSSEKVFVALAFTGTANVGIELMHWYADGCARRDYPSVQNTDDWSRLIVAEKNYVRIWEKGSAFPLVAIDDYIAYGSGSPYALGAMAAGAQAVTAVGCAARHCNLVGGGVDYVTLINGEEVNGPQANTGC